ncbi:MAG TPA: LuxR C-terminal-related transcriptional regulator, partial [Chloroflexota bacterium]
HRHQTLREVMNWSYNLLSPLEQALFARLSVFAGGWTLDAAQAICCDGAPAPEAFDPAAGAPRPEQPAHDTPFPGSGGSVLDLLGRLVDRSLVVVERDRHGASRYRMLETVREYASERLAEEGAREDLEVRHAEFYGTLALQVEPGLVGSDQAKHADRLEAELDNLRVAMGRSLERGRVDLALRVATALPQFFWMRGYYHEGREWLERCLEMEAERVREGFPRDSLQRARALDGAGLMAQCQADWDAAERYCEESLALWREINHMAGAGSALTNLGMLAMWRGRFSEAGPLLEESLSLELESGEPGGVVYALLYLALLALLTGDHLKAARFGAEAETRTRELGNQRARGAALGLRAWEYLERRDTAAAEQLCRACVGMLAEVGERWILALGIEVSAGVAAMKGQHRRAMKLAGGAAALRQAGRGALSPTLETTFERWLAPSREALDPRTAELAWAQGNVLTFEELVAAALATEGDGPAGADNPAVVGLAPLTRRENRVAALVASGLTNRRIARELEIGEGTVANHVERILRKLGLTSRSQIAAWVIEHQAPSPGYRAYSPGRHSPGAFPELF